MNGDLSWITNFIWGIADDVLRDLYVRGKYRDVILPMTVLRRLDAVLEPTKKAVLDSKANLDEAKITNQDAALRAASEQASGMEGASGQFELGNPQARFARRGYRSEVAAIRIPLWLQCSWKNGPAASELRLRSG